MLLKQDEVSGIFRETRCVTEFVSLGSFIWKAISGSDGQVQGILGRKQHVTKMMYD